jgi:hypothetical protein
MMRREANEVLIIEYIEDLLKCKSLGLTVAFTRGYNCGHIRMLQIRNPNSVIEVKMKETK